MSLGCERSDNAESGTRRYGARGIVRGLPPDHKTIDVEHEDIAGFMPSMTMPFEVRDEKEIANLKIGAAISFRLNVTQRDSWIDRIQKIDAGQLHLPTPVAEVPTRSDATKSTRLKEGDLMPEFDLLDQNGKPVSLETFRGRPVVLTFIFTRCPIPNFCPLMTRNFAELQKAIKSGGGPLAATRLLSVSFDPEHDTPAVLKEQAQHEAADPAIWTFATGTKPQIKELTSGFSVLVQPEAGTISHSLATALIDANGRIVEIWRGNGWKSEEIIEVIKTP